MIDKNNLSTKSTHEPQIVTAWKQENASPFEIFRQLDVSNEEISQV